MYVCYKCRTPFMTGSKPGFNDICEGCGSYLHCCSNCKFYDEYTKPHCSEPAADSALDANGMNHCEYFQFRVAKGVPLDDSDDPEQRRMRRRPDWRNLRKEEDQPRQARNQSRSEAPPSADSEERAKRARQQLDKLCGK